MCIVIIIIYWYLSSAVVEVGVVGPPRLEALPAKSMVTFAFHAKREKSSENIANYATIEHTVDSLRSFQSVCCSWGTS